MHPRDFIYNFIMRRGLVIRIRTHDTFVLDSSSTKFLNIFNLKYLSNFITDLSIVIRNNELHKIKK